MIKSICKISYRSAGSSTTYTNFLFRKATPSLTQKSEETDSGNSFTNKLEFYIRDSDPSSISSLGSIPLEILIELNSGDLIYFGNATYPARLVSINSTLPGIKKITFENITPYNTFL
jgi:hypothetical protein